MARMSARKARRLCERRREFARLMDAASENDRRLVELDALRNGPCPACVARGWVKPA